MREEQFIADAPGRWQVEEEPLELDPSAGYVAWLDATGKGESGSPLFGLSRTFPSWGAPTAVGRRLEHRPNGTVSRWRFRSFGPILAGIAAAGCGQVPDTDQQLEEFARGRPSWFLSREVAAGAAFDALRRGYLGESLCACALVATSNLRGDEATVTGEVRELVQVWFWVFDSLKATRPEQLKDAYRHDHRLHLAGNDIEITPPSLVLLPF